MITGLIIGLSILFLVLIGLFIHKVFKSKMQFRGEILATLFFIAAIIVSVNMFGFAIYIDDKGEVVDTFNLSETYVELDNLNGVFEKLVIAYNRDGITFNENYDRIFGDYHSANIVEIRRDVLGTKAVFI